MTSMSKAFDISRNVRIVEKLKGELLDSIATIYRIMTLSEVNDRGTAITEAISDTILISYILGKRLGLDYNTIERCIVNKIKLALIEENELEKYFGDLSELAKHKYQVMI